MSNGGLRGSGPSRELLGEAGANVLANEEEEEEQEQQDGPDFDFMQGDVSDDDELDVGAMMVETFRWGVHSWQMPSSSPFWGR